MRIAIPMAAGRLAMHFGHCEQFAVMDVDLERKTIVGQQILTPPPHEPGVLPRWLAEQHCTVIIAGGMGQRAVTLFQDQGIEVVVGAPSEEPAALVEAFLNQNLETGVNACDH